MRNQSDTLVIIMHVVGINICRTLINDGSSINVLYSKTLEQMGIPETYLLPYTIRLHCFSSNPIEVRGHITLIFELECIPRQRRTITDFIVVDLPSSYKAILERLILHKLKTDTSIYYYCMKFYTIGGVDILMLT